jgi:hypothetical protein
MDTAKDLKSLGPCAHESSILSSGTSKLKGLAISASPFFDAEIMEIVEGRLIQYLSVERQRR